MPVSPSFQPWHWFYFFAGPTSIASRLRVKDKNPFSKREIGRYIETPFHYGYKFSCTGSIEISKPVLKIPFSPSFQLCPWFYCFVGPTYIARRETMASASEKNWHQDILNDPDIESFPQLNVMWIYCQFYTNKFKIKYSFRGSRWKDHGKSVSHMESKLKRKHSK